MPFVPFQKKSSTRVEADTAAPEAPTFSKASFGKKRKRSAGRVAPAQKALMNPGGRSMSGGGR
jgi:hypothetical protein